jgi:hypothetical protein
MGRKGVNKRKPKESRPNINAHTNTRTGESTLAQSLQKYPIQQMQYEPLGWIEMKNQNSKVRI